MTIKKLISWNVNGLRAVHGKGFLDFVDLHKPDILCLQEIKATAEQLPTEINPIAGYFAFYNSAEKKGYSGTAIYTKIKPISVVDGIGIHDHDKEGRVQTAEFENFYLVNCYTPNVKPTLARLEYRIGWDKDFLNYLKNLEKSKPVILCGDLNVAHTEIDLARPDSNRGNAGFTDEEREGISNLLNSGFLDSFRVFYEEGGHYTWWSYRGGARFRNVGWRIDYVCVSESLKGNLKDGFILHDVIGSDHCPVGIDLIGIS